MNRHTHEGTVLGDRRTFGHDHERPTFGGPQGEHRHLTRTMARQTIVPPLVVGCTNVGHNEVDCYAAELPEEERCETCQEAAR
jgi:hypothetical protein